MAPATVPPPALAQPELLERLEAWSLDPPGARINFAQKLAQDNGWSARHAARVIAEYRRFLYLAMTAGHSVCPSDAVDQAWHQHLLDTRRYWEEFCPRVLGGPLHHTPSRGGSEEQKIMREWYSRTLASYQTTFAEAPPADLWPPVDQRLNGRERWLRVDAGRCWLLPRPRRWGLLQRGPGRGGARFGQWALLVALGVGVSGCGATRPPFPYSLNGPEFLLFYGLLTGLSLLVVCTLEDEVGGAKARFGGGVIMGGVWVLGLTRLIQGVMAGKPVILLILSVVMVTAALCTLLFTNHWIGSGSSGVRERGRSDDGGGGSGGCGSAGGGCGGGGCGGGGCGGCGG